MRIGVNTGEVVVRSIRKDDLHTDYVPVGSFDQHRRADAGDGETGFDPRDGADAERLTEGYFDLKHAG